MRKHLAALSAVAMVGMIVSVAPAGAAGTVTVTQSNMQGWTESSSPPATDGSFVNGPATPPAGAGSLHMMVSTGATNNDAVQLRHPAYNNTKLADLTQLAYSTYVSNTNNTGQAPYIILNVDRDNDGDVDEQMFFEPVYQNGTYGTASGATVPNQCGSNPACVSQNTWQSWNALTGGWWLLTANTGGPPLTTIAKYVQMWPNAVIRNAASGAGGIRVVAGFGNPPWGGFHGNVDAFKIGVSGDETTFDFENQAASSASSASSISSSSSTSVGQCPNGTSLVGHWKFDEQSGTIALDSSGGGRNGTLENGPTRVAGMHGGALSFDGTNDQVRVPNAQGLRFGSGSFTVSAWLKAAQGDGNRSVLGNYNGSNRGWGLYAYPTTANFFAYGSQGINDMNQPAATLLNSQWHHVVGVYSRSGSAVTIRTYVDGALAGTSTMNVGDISSTSDLLFGKYLNQPSFKGSLDDIRIYNRALSMSEVGQLNGGCASQGSSSSQSSSVSSGTGSSASSISSTSSTSSVTGQVPTCQGIAATIFVRNGMIVGGRDDGERYRGSLRGTDGDDVIVGTAERDRVRARDGDDVVCGLGGNDNIDGDDGADWIDGGAGNDNLDGDDGDDTIYGGGDNDDIDGDDGADTLCAQGGNDRVDGDDDNDVLDGGAGTDRLRGGRDTNSCYGGEDVKQCGSSNAGSATQCGAQQA